MKLKKLVEDVAHGTAEFDELIEALMFLLRGSQELSADTALELSTALIELETAGVVDDQLFSLVNTHGAAALALAQSGQILAANAAAAATAASAVETAGRTLGNVPRTHQEGPLEFGSVIRNPRLVVYRRFGNPSGTTVLLIHGPSFGAGEYSEDRRLGGGTMEPASSLRALILTVAS